MRTINAALTPVKAITPPFGAYAAHEATLEGELRFTHSRLLENAEEVALYHGEEFEKNVIERGYFALVKHANRVLRIRVWHGMAEEGGECGVDVADELLNGSLARLGWASALYPSLGVNCWAWARALLAVVPRVSTAIV